MCAMQIMINFLFAGKMISSNVSRTLVSLAQQRAWSVRAGWKGGGDVM